MSYVLRNLFKCSCVVKAIGVIEFLPTSTNDPPPRIPPPSKFKPFLRKGVATLKFRQKHIQVYTIATIHVQIGKNPEFDPWSPIALKYAKMNVKGQGRGSRSQILLVRIYFEVWIMKVQKLSTEFKKFTVVKKWHIKVDHCMHFWFVWEKNKNRFSEIRYPFFSALGT